MILFALCAALLIAVCLIFLLPPLWLGRRPQAGADRQQANLTIFRDQLAELERERADGSLAGADFEEARQELEKRLIEEIDQAPEAAGGAVVTPAPAAALPTRKTAWLLLLALPLLALAGYAVLGQPRALDPAQRAAAPRMTPEQINAMVDKLAARMQANPDDEQGWLMLARSYKTLERYPEAAAAYAKAEKTINGDPELLSSYAETLAMAGGKGLQGKPALLVERALKLDPKHAHSLFLAGAAAMERGDRAAAIRHWEALLPQVEPGSEIDNMLRGSIERLKSGQ